MKNTRIEVFELLDATSEQEFGDIVMIASQICEAEMAAISYLDGDRFRYVARVGFSETEVPRELAFCSHTILNTNEPFVVEDTLLDERFKDYPLLISGKPIRFYAGVTLWTEKSNLIGTLCIADFQPKKLGKQQMIALQALANQQNLRFKLSETTLLLKRANKELKMLSLKDDLTGLYNRRGFNFHAEQQLKVFRSRLSEQGMWVLMGDMDNLKRINDKFSHHEGSEAIKKVGEILTDTFRDADIVARVGGDEFVVLIVNTLDEVAKTIPKRLQEQFDHYNRTSGKGFKIELSIGLTKVRFLETTTMAEIVHAADKQMYLVKRSRKSGILNDDINFFSDDAETIEMNAR